MPRQRNDTDTVPIGELLQQLVEDGRNVAHAELSLLRAIARYRLGEAKHGAIALAGSFVLGLSAAITLLVMLAEGLAVHIGPVSAGIVVAGAAAVIALFLLRMGIRRISVIAGSDEEDEALRRGERRS